MDNCSCKKSYHFNVTQVVDGKIKEVMDFNFGGHHDLAEMVQKVEATGEFTDKHAKELVCGIRLLHHVMKKYPENPLFKDFAAQFKAFKDQFKATICK